MSITLTIDQVKAAARQAHAENRLIAQHPGEELKYLNKQGHVCAIGAALTPDEAKTIQKLSYVFIDTMFNFDQITSPDTDASDVLREIQRTHDYWCGLTHNAGDAAKAETQFLALIQ